MKMPSLSSEAGPAFLQTDQCQILSTLRGSLHVRSLSSQTEIQTATDGMMICCLLIRRVIRQFVDGK